MTTAAGGCVQRDTALITLYPAPDTITGNTSVCPRVRGVTYSIRHPKNVAYQGTVTGGTIAGGQGTSTITVDWGPATTNASVRVAGRSAFGYPAAPVVFPVRVSPVLATPTPIGPRWVRAGSTQTYQTQDTNDSVYNWQISGGTQYKGWFEVVK